MVQSLPTRGAWIEIYDNDFDLATRMSLPTRGAWIEIADMLDMMMALSVAPHAGSAD